MERGVQGQTFSCKSAGTPLPPPAESWAARSTLAGASHTPPRYILESGWGARSLKGEECTLSAGPARRSEPRQPSGRPSQSRQLSRRCRASAHLPLVARVRCVGAPLAARLQAGFACCRPVKNRTPSSDRSIERSGSRHVNHAAPLRLMLAPAPSPGCVLAPRDVLASVALRTQGRGQAVQRGDMRRNRSRGVSCHRMVTTGSW